MHDSNSVRCRQNVACLVHSLGKDSDVLHLAANRASAHLDARFKRFLLHFAQGSYLNYFVLCLTAVIVEPPSLGNGISIPANICDGLLIIPSDDKRRGLARVAGPWISEATIALHAGCKIARVQVSVEYRSTIWCEFGYGTLLTPVYNPSPALHPWSWGFQGPYRERSNDAY